MAAGMLAEVTQLKVRALLEQRDPAILDDTAPERERFEARVAGASVQVVLLVGPDPTAPALRALAVEAIAAETASQLEYALYPEQQAPGGAGRGWSLHQRYNELLADLRRIVALNGGAAPATDEATITSSMGVPRVRAPRAMSYPDPIRVRGRADL